MLMTFNYVDKNNQIKPIDIKTNDQWNSYKKDSPSSLNSIFDIIDANSDGKVDKDELDILQKLLKVADSQIEETKNNNIIENEELELLVNKFKNNELETLEGNKPPELITPKFIELPKDKDKLSNYSYLIKTWGQKDNDTIDKVTVDYSVLNDLDEGKYYIADFEYSKDANGDRTNIQTPVVRKIQNSNQDGTTNWSEGINRNIKKIQLDKGNFRTLIEFMNNVGKEQGFEVEILDGKETWIEDLSIVRPDKKQLIPHSSLGFKMKTYDNESKIIAKRNRITINTQGHAFQTDKPNKPSHAEQYSISVSKDDVIEGKTYLEGGNVLNTLTKNGEPGAIIGNESIQYTLLAMNSDNIANIKDLENSKDLVNKAKKQIAFELGIKEENITYIPQFDFHIDMHYRPLHDGQVGIPDYEAGINILKGFVQDIDKQIDANSQTSEKTYNNLENQKEKYLKLITKLEDMKVKTEEISKEAENNLKANGYEIARIPCFTDIDDGNPIEKSVEDSINYMNGICGTSDKTGDTFYITNTSGDAKLDAYMEKYFQNTIGIDKVYFAPTKKYLENLGGLDCISKEL